MGAANWAALAWADALSRRMRRSLSAAELAAVASLPLAPKTIPAGSYFSREGDAIACCCLLQDGILIESKLTQSGARQIVGVRLHGEFVGLQSIILEDSDIDLQAPIKSTIIAVNATSVRHLCAEHSELAKAMTAEALRAGAIAKEWVINVGRRHPAARLAHLLCELAVRSEGTSLSDGGTFKLALTQEQLGDAVGLGRAAVNRAMRDFTASGLIVQRDHRLTIVDAGRLQDAGDFSARYLHLGQSSQDRRKSSRPS